LPLRIELHKAKNGLRFGYRVIKRSCRVLRGTLVTKSELVLRLAGQNPNLVQRDVEKVIATIRRRIKPDYWLPTGSRSRRP
jgi:hypothetical protein